MIVSNKKAIQDHSVFDGLYVPDKDYYADLFMKPAFKLVEMKKNGQKAYVIFQIIGKTFVFHLVNFTKCKTQTMTEDFMQGFVKPLCKFRGLEFVQASVERVGMARKLEKLGFEHIGNNTYKGAVNVL